MIAIAKGIVRANDRIMLKENRGTIELGNKWGESITNWIGFAKRKATTAKSIIAPGLISEMRHTFSTILMKSSKLVKSHLHW